MKHALTPRPLSLADLEAMPDDGNSYELLEGQIVVNPPPTPTHQQVSYELQKRIEAALPAGFRLFDAPVGLALIDEQYVEPDLVVVPVQNVRPTRLTTPALLVVEVVSKGSARRDYVVKREEYAASGVEHYWIVDVERDRVVAYRLDAMTSAYELVVDQTGGLIELVEPVSVSFVLRDLSAPPA